MVPGPGHSNEVSPTVSQGIDARHRCELFWCSLSRLSGLRPPICLDLHNVQDTVAHLLWQAQILHRLLANLPPLQNVSSQL